MKSERKPELSPSERRPTFSKLRELASAALHGLKNSLVGNTQQEATGYVILDDEIVYDQKTAAMLGLPQPMDDQDVSWTSSLPLTRAKEYLEDRRDELDIYARPATFSSALEGPIGMVGSGTSFDDMVNGQLWRVNRALSEIDSYLQPTDK